MHRLIIGILLTIAFACKSGTPASSQQQSIESWTQKNLGADITILKNQSNSFALCTKENSSLQTVTYYLVRISDFEIVERDNIQPATITWLDNQHIEIKFTPGIIKRDEQNIPIKIIDITKYQISKQ
jgi:hypothetical protein